MTYHLFKAANNYSKKDRHGIKVSIIKHMQASNIRLNIKRACPSSKCMFMWIMTYLYSPHCITAPMASMHDHVNPCSWHWSKEMENKTLIYHVKSKQTIKQRNRDLKHESRQGRYMFHGRKQRNRDENVELGFLGTNMRVT